MKTAQTKEWSDFHEAKVGGGYSKWPNEPMLKTLFGSYSVNSIKPEPGWRVLDVGCGFGNNLTPFADLGCECHGVEIEPKICSIAENILASRGYQAKIVEGQNRALPYPSAHFDLLLSVATIHYESTQENVIAALREFRRVTKPGGRVYISTVGPNHKIQSRAEVLGDHRYLIRNYDFRNGQEFFFFDNESYFEFYLKQVFDQVEVGRVTENLFSMTVDHMIALCS